MFTDCQFAWHLALNETHENWHYFQNEGTVNSFSSTESIKLTFLETSNTNSPILSPYFSYKSTGKKLLKYKNFHHG